MTRTTTWLAISMLCALLGVLFLAGATWIPASAGMTAEAGMTAAISWPKITLASTVSGLDLPVHITNAGDGSGRLFVVERPGRIRIVKNGVLLPAPFLDITGRVRSVGGEQGLLSVSFPPDYSTKGHFYVDYTDLMSNTVVARFAVTADPDLADPGSEQIVLNIYQPFANHNGGQLAFGPHDGYLYIGMGDGGSGGDPFGNAQNPASWLGKLLRIDVETGNPLTYTIPATNPFTQTAGYRGEIWALGLRNPWRFAFDPLTGDLYIGDVGQNQYEEVDVQPAASSGGQNYGWNIMEGFHCYNATTCDMTGLTLPVVEYDHSGGNCSITGGGVYRGAAYPGLAGIYFYGDYCSGRIWGLRYDGIAWQNTVLYDTPFTISTFGQDEAGSLWLAQYATAPNGTIHKIIRGWFSYLPLIYKQG
jgi:glucose/arabinose dehydrogenase